MCSGRLGRRCILLYQEQLVDIKEAGATDSKNQSQEKGSSWKHSSNWTGEVVQITPQQIDDGNINTLEEVLPHLSLRPDVVYIDAPAHQRRSSLSKRLCRRRLHAGHMLPQFIIEPKADLNYPVVGAASILQKYCATVHWSTWRGRFWIPHDPTRNWIKGFLSGEKNCLLVFAPDGTIETLRNEAQNEPWHIHSHVQWRETLSVWFPECSVIGSWYLFCSCCRK